MNDSLCDMFPGTLSSSSCVPSSSSALGTGTLTGHLHQWDKGKKGEFETQHMLFAFPIVWCLAGKFVLSHYDTENERGSIVPQDGVRTDRNNIQYVDVGGRWQPDCVETSQTIYPTSKTITQMFESDLFKNIFLCMYVYIQYIWTLFQQTSLCVFFCCSLLSCVCHFEFVHR